MTVKTDTNAVTQTNGAISSASAKGHNLPAMQSTLALMIEEARVLLKQIILLTPAGDANLPALNALLAAMA
jgi:hypothetical protein